jgi:hypothetical protein
MIFKQDGYISRQKDMYGNTVLYEYANIDEYEDVLVKITDGSDQVIELKYYDDEKNKGKLKEIIDSAGRKTTYNYEAGHLRYIDYPGGKQSRYGYNTENHELMYVKAPDLYERHYQFLTDCGVRRTASVMEVQGSQVGNQLKITYLNGNTTVFEETGMNGVLEESGSQ